VFLDKAVFTNETAKILPLKLLNKQNDLSTCKDMLSHQDIGRRPLRFVHQRLVSSRRQ
jgi:hypothetical protein